MRSFTQSLLILSCLILAACSAQEKRPEEFSEREFYEQAREAMEDNNFLIASERLKQLESRYPFGQYAEQAQLELIYTQHMMADMEASLASAERFIRLHPLHKQVDYAYYMRGLSVYELGFSFVERYTPSEQARRDPTPFRDAFNHFDELVRRYPNSQYNEDAQKRMIFLRDRLAQYEIGVGRFYMKRHAYLAAAQRGERVMLNYQGTSVVDDALALQVEAYKLLGQEFESNQALALLKLNYPEHEQFDEEGNFVDSGLTKKDRRTLIGVMSFGLIE
ncbi:MAG: outer membrane protein assembly factor BamD [Oleispira sp.]|nr:outer membrane protein assembly factor BamD [Oleispira sp.]